MNHLSLDCCYNKISHPAVTEDDGLATLLKAPSRAELTLKKKQCCIRQAGNCRYLVVEKLSNFEFDKLDTQ